MNTERDSLISSYKESNKSLRKRAVSIGILMILVVAFKYNTATKNEKSSELINYQYSLETICQLPDSLYRAVICDTNENQYFNWNTISVVNLEHIRLFRRVKNNNFQRSIIEEEIDNIGLRIKEADREESIALLGFNIPVEPITYLALVLILILFHDFTQTFIYRSRLTRSIRRCKLKDWEFGFELFGGETEMKKNTISKYTYLISTIIILSVILSPIVSSYLMLDYNYTDSYFLFGLNIFCFIVVIADSLIILYTDNLLNIRYFANTMLGRYNTTTKTLRWYWFTLCTTIVLINMNLALDFNLHYEIFQIKALFFLFNFIPAFALFLCSFLIRKNTSKIFRSIRAGLILLNVFCLSFVIDESFYVNSLSIDNLYEMWNMFIIATIACACYVFLYRFYLIDKSKS